MSPLNSEIFWSQSFHASLRVSRTPQASESSNSGIAWSALNTWVAVVAATLWTTMVGYLLSASGTCRGRTWMIDTPNYVEAEATTLTAWSTRPSTPARSHLVTHHCPQRSATMERSLVTSWSLAPWACSSQMLGGEELSHSMDWFRIRASIAWAPNPTGGWRAKGANL